MHVQMMGGCNGHMTRKCHVFKPHHLLIQLSVQILTILTGSDLIENFYQYNQLTDSFLSTTTQVKVMDQLSDQNAINPTFN